MSTRYSLLIARLVRLFAVLVLTLGAIGLTPLSLPVLASPAAGPAASTPAAPALGLLPAPVPTLFVTTTSIANNAVDGQCDLWEALQAVFQANFDLSPTYHECTALKNAPNVIGFSGGAAGGTILVPLNVGSGDLPFAWGDTTILGPVTIKPSATNTETHLLQMAGNATLTLIAVTLSDGHTSGGGAAILDFNHATVNVIGSNIAGNVADNDGGAINSNGNVNVVLSNFSGNEARGLFGSTGYGGAINISGAGTLSIAKSNFAGNTAKAGGGAIYSTTPNGTIEDSLFSGNIGGQDISLNKGGGAIYNDVNGALGIARTQFAGNLSPQGNGGAVYNNSGASMVISDTTFAANLAGDPTHATLGGAIYDQASLTVQRSSFANNISVQGDGGGIAVDRHGTADVANTTFVVNLAPNGSGGAVVITQTQTGGPASTFTARNVTIASNAATSGHGGGIFNGPGQNLTLGNSLLDTNIGLNCAGGGNLTSLGHNLDSGTTCGLSGPGDLQNGSANLGGPSFNGGPLASMLTLKLQVPSDAIDHGDNAICAGPLVNNEDQRGNKRPIDGTNPGNLNPICDIGAYEADAPSPGFASVPSEPGPINVGNVQIGNTVNTTLVVSNTGNYFLDLTGLALTGSNPGDFSVSLAPIHINVNDPPVSLVIGCTPSQAGQRTALLGFATTDKPLHVLVGYQLKCTGNVAPAAGFSASPIPPGPISFPKTIFGNTSNLTIQVSEAGNLHLDVSHNPLTGANPGDFSVSGDTFSIADGGPSHNITLQCTPSDVGLRSATLTLTTNDGSQPSVVYALTCVGVPLPSAYLAAGASLGNSPDRGLHGAYGVAIPADGKNVYVTSNPDGTVSSFSRNPINGALGFIGKDDDLPYSAGSFLIAMSPDGQNAYVAGRTNKAIVEWSRDPVTGRLITPNHYPRSDLGGAYGLAVSPDGRSVYATGTYSNSIVVFSRDIATGQLTQIQTLISSNLDGAAGVTVSPDGQNVYVADYTSDPTNNGKLEVLKRSAADGTLSFLQTRFQGDCIDFVFCFGGLDGLKGAYQVSVSPDGLNVYLVSYYSSAIVAFSRNQVNGSLHLLYGYFNNTLGVTGLGGATGVDSTPDGLHVLTAGYTDKAVTVFGRDPATGYLTFNQTFQRSPLSGGSPTLPLDGALETRVSQDGLSVYTSANIDNAIVVLQVANPVPTIDNLNAASVIKDTPNVTMMVNGSNFVPGASVKVGVANQAATYVNSHQLSVDMSSFVHVVGTQTIKVFNPAPGGGLSNGKTFTVVGVGQHPVPSIDHITPQGGLAGGNGLTLDVYGTNYINGSSTVFWNGFSRSTTFIDIGHLQASIPQADVSQPGTSGVTVITGGPGGGTSNAVSFTVAQPGQNAIPSLTGINPLWVFSLGAASKEIQMTVTGQNFIQGSMAQIDGANRPTLFVDSGHLQVTIFGSDLYSPGTSGITVFTPAPGGGSSNALTFTIRKLYRLVLPLIRK